MIILIFQILINFDGSSAFFLNLIFNFITVKINEPIYKFMKINPFTGNISFRLILFFLHWGKKYEKLNFQFCPEFRPFGQSGILT